MSELQIGGNTIMKIENVSGKITTALSYTTFIVSGVIIDDKYIIANITFTPSVSVATESLLVTLPFKCTYMVCPATWGNNGNGILYTVNVGSTTALYFRSHGGTVSAGTTISANIVMSKA